MKSVKKLLTVMDETAPLVVEKCEFGCRVTPSKLKGVPGFFRYLRFQCQKEDPQIFNPKVLHNTNLFIDLLMQEFKLLILENCGF